MILIMYLACDLYFFFKIILYIFPVHFFMYEHIYALDVHIECFSLKTCLLCIFFYLITLDEHEWKYSNSGRLLGW